MNLKFLISKLREVGVTIVKTTEFVQGQTCRWGLAWSFVPPAKKIISPRVTQKNILSFMLEVWPFSLVCLNSVQISFVHKLIWIYVERLEILPDSVWLIRNRWIIYIRFSALFLS